MSQVVVMKASAPSGQRKLSRRWYGRLLKAGLGLFCESGSAVTALQRLLPDGPVGLKTNCLVQRLNSTPEPLVAALGDLLEDAGWAANDLIVWERTSRELSEAGFELNASSFGRRCLGTDARGVGFSRAFYRYGEVNSLVSRIMTEMVVSCVNLPILKDHSLAGLSGSLKNMYGAINNPNKYHGDNCDPYVAHVAALEPIRARQKLVVMDAVQVQYDRGPGYSAQCLESYGGVVLSDDPVAADRVGLEIVERLRKAHKLPSLTEAGRPASYLQTAREEGLGESELDKIDVITLSVDEHGAATKGELF